MEGILGTPRTPNIPRAIFRPFHPSSLQPQPRTSSSKQGLSLSLITSSSLYACLETTLVLRNASSPWPTPTPSHTSWGISIVSSPRLNPRGGPSHDLPTTQIPIPIATGHQNLICNSHGTVELIKSRISHHTSATSNHAPLARQILKSRRKDSQSHASKRSKRVSTGSCV